MKTSSTPTANAIAKSNPELNPVPAQTRRWGRWCLLVIHPMFQGVVYAGPLILMITISFWRMEHYELVPTWTLENYAELAAGDTERRAMLSTLWVALVSACLAVCLAVPAAGAITFHLPRTLRPYVLLALLLPFLSSIVIRMMSWQLWLTDNGIIAFTLQRAGWTGASGFIYTLPAMFVGRLSVLVPLAAVIVYLSLSRADLRLVSAARNLGASRVQLCRYVLLPFAMPGIAVSFMLCFVWSLGDAVAPSVLGGNRTYFLSTLLSDRLKVNDLPLAAALCTITVAICALGMWLLFRALRLSLATRFEESGGAG